jgi:hypothetical protein
MGWSLECAQIRPFTFGRVNPVTQSATETETANAWLEQLVCSLHEDHRDGASAFTFAEASVSQSVSQCILDSRLPCIFTEQRRHYSTLPGQEKLVSEPPRSHEAQYEGASALRYLCRSIVVKEVHGRVVLVVR